MRLLYCSIDFIRKHRAILKKESKNQMCTSKFRMYVSHIYLHVISKLFIVYIQSKQYLVVYKL